jgi:hypothetical protein
MDYPYPTVICLKGHWDGCEDTNYLEDEIECDDFQNTNHFNNFNLSDKAQKFADKLISDAEKKSKDWMGLGCKTNIRLTDDLEMINEDEQ